MAKFQNRAEVFDFLDNYSYDRKSEIDSRKLKGKLLKAYVIETSLNCPNEIEIMTQSLEKDACTIIDDGLILTDSSVCGVNFIEKINNRYWISYSHENAIDADSKISKLIKNDPRLDNLWLSGLFFDSFWQELIEDVEDHRIIKMSFEFTDKYEEMEELDYKEQPKNSSNLIARKGILSDNLNALRSTSLDAFNCITALRYPSIASTGGNDFYSNGKVTNRSDNFREFRDQIIYIIKWYQQATNIIEHTSWLDSRTINNHEQSFSEFIGSPITIEFEQELEMEKFLNFIDSVFKGNNSPFRIWGEPIEISSSVYQVYGLDMHLFNEIYIEFTPKMFTIILPNESCGNTVHRMITNIQKNLSPRITVTVGSKDFSSILRESVRERP